MPQIKGPENSLSRALAIDQRSSPAGNSLSLALAIDQRSSPAGNSLSLALAIDQRSSPVGNGCLGLWRLTSGLLVHIDLKMVEKI